MQRMNLSNFSILILLTTIFILSGISTPEANADASTLSDAATTNDALTQTKTLLRTRTKRSAYINENKDARQADNAVKAISSNPKHVQEVYDISADIMDQIVQETGGDVMKLQELLIKAAANPRAFHHRLSASQKARIRSLAAEIEEEKTPAK